jgi:hypothetical protein
VQRIFFRASPLLLGLFGLAQPAICAQTVSASPLSASTSADSATPKPPSSSGAHIIGTVLDNDGAVVEGASVSLAGPPGFQTLTHVSGSDGQFSFAALPPATYSITVTAPGMTTFKSPPILLHAGDFHLMSPVTIAFSAGTTSVTVVGNEKQLSEEQVQIAVHQRVLGVIPNFYSSYDWNAPPMQAKQKFQLGFRSVFDPVSLLAVAGVAGAEQYVNAFPQFGGGITGYGKRYGAAMANHVSADLLSRAVYPAIFHQDPRYFYKGRGSTGSRALYAISAAVMTRSDSGHWEPNYSNVLGNFSASALSNLYYPSADRGASLVFLNGLADTGADAASNLIREFVLKKLTSRASKQAVGQP